MGQEDNALEVGGGENENLTEVSAALRAMSGSGSRKRAPASGSALSPSEGTAGGGGVRRGLLAAASRGRLAAPGAVSGTLKPKM